MTDIEDRLRRELAREAARAHAGMLRPLSERPSQDLSRVPRLRAAGGVRSLTGRRAGRWLAPAAAVVAVAAVIAGVSLAGAGVHSGGTGPRRPAAVTAPAAGMPRFYVSLTFPPTVRAEVHDARTGQVLSSVLLPRAEQGPGTPPSIAAAADNRTFAITAEENLGNDETDVRVLMLHVSADGRSARLTALPLRVTSPGSADFVDGIALSPDGSKLAVAVQIPTDGFRPYAELKVVSLTAGFKVRTWATRKEYALLVDPVWEAGGRYLGFAWQGHIKGPVSRYTAVTQVRLLDTAAPGSNLLTSRVIVVGGHGLGFIQDALLAANGRSVIVAAYRNVAGKSGHGIAVLKLAELSVPGGRVARVFLVRSVRYHGASQENAADSSCAASAVAAGWQHALVQCPRFARLDNGRFTLLPEVGILPIVAW